MSGIVNEHLLTTVKWSDPVLVKDMSTQNVTDQFWGKKDIHRQMVEVETQGLRKLFPNFFSDGSPARMVLA